MIEIMKFENHPEIGDKIFNYLDSKTLLNCQFVCQDWKQFLQNPYFWLKKLKEVGQPEEIENAWKNLITKAPNYEVNKSIFAECLQNKFKDFIFAQDEDESIKNKSIFYLNSPPIFTAAYYGHIEIVKLIYELGEDFNRSIYWKPNLHLYKKNYFEMPMFAAIENGHTDVAKFFADSPQESGKLYTNAFGCTPLQIAIQKKNFELVKFFVQRTQNLNYRNRANGYSLMHYAICDFTIFQYLMSQPGIKPNLLNNIEQTPLQTLCNDENTFHMNHPPGDITKMVNILAPLANKERLYSWYGNPLIIAAGSGANEALKALLNFFDPNVSNRDGALPIEMAIRQNEVEAVKVLAPYMKELKMSRFIDYGKKNAKAYKVMQALIAERKGISRSEINRPTKKRIRVDLTEDNVYELPFEKKFEVFTKDQMERMIYLLKQEQLQK